MRATRLLLIVFVVLLLPMHPSIGNVDELTRVYAQLLRDPTNIELNLRYARMAEARGEPRKALAAYERVLAQDPSNREVEQALLRVRRELQPNVTQYLVELGTAWESNPQRLPSGRRGEWDALARVTVRDDRTIGSLRWRTIGALAGEFHTRNSDLSYGYAGGETGPVIDLNLDWSVHVAVGGGASYFNHRSFYNEAFGSLTFQSQQVGNIFQSLRLRGGYRWYDDFFPTEEGFYAEAVYKLSILNAIASDDLLIFAPGVRWSDISGTGFSIINADELIPGKYFEYGTKIEYYRKVLRWLSLGGLVSIHQRDFAHVAGDPRRRDLLIIPGTAAIIHNVMRQQTDLRIDYRYEHNDSNDPMQSFNNHVVTMMLLNRF